MKTLKVVLQEVISGVKAWANDNFSLGTHVHGNITNDGKVGTTANLPLITGTGGAVQAGSFGNAANTFCEGNDSRLSDARTPVAHTHTKSNVTDLLNSNFIPSANNSYDLGSSSYQWNNLYAKNYYYNGVAWGLDKDNTWSGAQKISASSNSILAFKYGTNGSYDDIRFNDENNSQFCGLRAKASYTAITQKYSSASVWYTGSSIILDSNGSIRVIAYDGTENWTINFSSIGIYPTSNNALELGTSTNKWKTLNGINPGALSLPGAYQSINDQIKDPNGQLNAFDLNGGSNTWVSDVDCYLYFYIPNNKFTWIRIFWPPTLVRCGQTFVPVPNESSDYSGFVPVPANTTVVIQVKGTQAPIFRRSACLGNV